MYDTILVATDGSEHARQAVGHAIELAGEHGATLHVLAVIDRRVHNEPGLSTNELVTIETEDWYRECLAGVEQQAATAGIDVECKVCHGIPPERILEYADEVDADVILVGVHGDHATHLGRVGRTVLEESDREIRVVEPGNP